MQLNKFSGALFFLGLSLLTAPSVSFAATDPNPDPDATVVSLKTSCLINNIAGGGQQALENCFESLSALKQWIYQRTVFKELLVEIGPGNFSGVFVCGDPSFADGGKISFRGSGVGVTTIGRVRTICPNSNWDFSDLTINADAGHAVFWDTGGQSNWHNVVMISGAQSAWYDAGGSANPGSGNGCEAGEQGVHRFTSVRFVTRVGGQNQSTILNQCGDLWLWGSEVLLNLGAGNSGQAVQSGGPGNRIHMYGGNVRAESDPNSTSGSITAVTVSGGAVVHMHGVGVDTVGGANMNATALAVSVGGEIHADSSAYVLRSGLNGHATRLSNGGGHIHAPYFWQHIPDPAVTPNFSTSNNTDRAIKVRASDGYPVSVVFNRSVCQTVDTPWLDPNDGACYGY